MAMRGSSSTMRMARPCKIVLMTLFSARAIALLSTRRCLEGCDVRTPSRTANAVNDEADRGRSPQRTDPKRVGSSVVPIWGTSSEHAPGDASIETLERQNYGY